jgi:hypothetical protein
MDAAEDLSVGFHPVANNTAMAVRANRRQRVDRALEAVKSVTLAGEDYFKRLVIFILANFACSHPQLFRAPLLSWRCRVIRWTQSLPFRQVEIA